MDIGTVLGTLKTSIDLAKDLKNAKALMGNAEVKLQVVNLIEALVDTKTDLSEIKDQLLDKEEEIRQLKEKINRKETVFYEAPFYWIDLGDGKKDGEFCQKCYDDKGKLSRIIRKDGFIKGSHHCSVCDTWYGKGARITRTVKPKPIRNRW